MTAKTIKVGDKVVGFKGDRLYFGPAMDAYIGKEGTVVQYDGNDNTVELQFSNGQTFWYAVDEIPSNEVAPKVQKVRNFPIVWSVNDSEGYPNCVASTRKEAREEALDHHTVVKYLAESDVQDTATVKGDTIWVIVKKDDNQFQVPTTVIGCRTRQDARDWIAVHDKTLKVVKYVAVKS